MNCCNHNDEKNTSNKISNNENTHKHKGHKHGLLMIILCLIPMGVIFLGPLLNKANDSQSNPLVLLFILLCPLMHILMMFGMRRNHDNDK